MTTPVSGKLFRLLFTTLKLELRESATVDVAVFAIRRMSRPTPYWRGLRTAAALESVWMPWASN